MALTPYAQQEIAPWQRGMGNIGTALLRGPLLRSQAIANSARAIEEAQMGRAAGSRADLLDAQRGEIATGDKRVDDATTAASAANKAFLAYQQNPTPDNRQAWQDAVSDATGKASAVKNMKVGDLMKAIGQSGALDLSGSGSTNYAQMGADQGQAASIANTIANASERANRPVIIPSGGTEASPTGDILAQGGATIPSGDTRLGPASGQTVPDVIASNPKPVKPAGVPPSVLAPAFRQLLMNSQGGTNVDQAMSEMQPYISGQPLPANGQSVPTATPGADAGLSGHMVKVQDATGNVGFIPAENLAAALQRGAKQIP